MKALKRRFAISFVALAFLACGARVYAGDQSTTHTQHQHPSKKFAFLRYVGEWGGELSQLYTVRSNGSDLKAVGPLRRYDFASLSPDETKIVAAVWQTSYFGADCVIMNGDGSSYMVLLPANTQPSAGCATPSFSPDGSKIVFSMNGDLMTMKTDGSNPVIVLKGVYSYGFVFTRDGKHIVANIWGALYLVSLDGTQILVSTLDVWEPTISVDGTKIFFRLPFTGYFTYWPPQLPTAQLFVMNADGTNVQQLTFEGLNMSPIVVGTRVMFVSDRAAPLVSIYSMKEDGSGIRAVTNSPQWDAFNSILWWNPDNRGD